jgi:hypothetical protein
MEDKRVIEMVNKVMEERNAFTRARVAYDLMPRVPTEDPSNMSMTFRK